MVDPNAPMSLGAVIAIIGVVMTWILGGIAIRKFVIEERKKRRDDEAHLEKLIAKVCQSFTESDAYQLRRDKAMIAVAQSVNDEAFRLRAPSFVDAAVDLERRVQMEREREQVDRRLAAMERAVADLRSDFKAAALEIAKEVVKEIRER